MRIEEPNLLSLHRSTHPLVPVEDYCQGHLCDAFICVVNEYNLQRVYVALHDQQLKSNFIFIADPIKPDNKKLEALLLKAHAFIATIGFKMEQVNLGFSSATREVIIKDVRVLREPSPALQLDAAKIALEALVAEKKELSRKASQEQTKLKAEVASLKTRLIAATESDLQCRSAASDDAEAVHQAAIADLKGEINRLMTMREDKNLAETSEADVLRAALADANVLLAFEKSKNESALQEMDALERNASAELKLLKKKVDTLTSEKQLLEKTTTEIKLKACGEIERQQQVNQSQRKTAIKKLHALKEEIRLLNEARAVIASPTGHPLAQSGDNGGSLPSNDRNEIISQQTDFSSGLFGSAETAEYLNFLPEKLLKGVPYSFSSEVVEVYRSYNTIYAAPVGKRAQKCTGFVCLVNDGVQSLVYVAWAMNSSGETLICLPEFAADGDDDSCQRIVRAGIGYFERIGFLIDRIPLEEEPDKRQAQLDSLEIFCRTVSECAA